MAVMGASSGFAVSSQAPCAPPSLARRGASGHEATNDQQDAAFMSETGFDVIVIGAGPGGYVCAIRAAQLGLKVACVEKRDTLGGTCLNIGCIPSKALLHSSEHYEEAVHKLADHGVNVGPVTLDLERMHARKGEVVSANVKGVEFLFKKNKITWLKGEGRITAPGQVTVGDTAYAAKNIVIATGSDSINLPGVAVDEKQIVTSTGALELAAVPKHLVVIGGGVIGLELGSVWRRLGAEVTVVEFLDRLVPTMDNELGKAFERILGKQGFKFRLKTKVTGATTDDTGVTLTLEPAAGGAAETLQADVVLVAIGRRAHTASLGLAEVGVAMDDRGRVATDGHFATNVPGIWAIGDVIAGAMLAHKAEEEGVALAEILAGQTGHVNYGAIPGVVYTWPEVASVGETEEELKARGQAYKVGKFPFMANARARAMGDVDGFVKILADKDTDKVLGAHIIGPDAGTLIAEIVLAIEFGASSEDIARTCHAHPSLNEAVKEAALAVEGRALHI
ncbi:dihydrolipoyl dehydrogenase [Humitalea sp. 24SJ18S-53]|uniref:dihydrolipoyl dehydrogenase n=1 Tax=Humitalea sp. 24SJ18S-53 TaxID=3422307 RepID=UPI003D677F15